MSMGGSSDPGSNSSLSEINVTPLVDVMLVLLTIFMVASSVETIQVAAEREKLLKERQEEDERTLLLAKLERLEEKEDRHQTDQRRDRRQMQFMQLQEEKLKEMEKELDDRSQNVPIELPKATSEAVNLAEEKKIVLTLTREHAVYMGDTRIIDCMDVAFGPPPGADGAAGPDADATTLSPERLRSCFAAIEKKLLVNEKLKADKEGYLRADRRLDYGEVLRLMATIRKAGITKFGLVAEELQDGENIESGKP